MSRESRAPFVVVDDRDVPPGTEARWFTLRDDALEVCDALNRGESVAWPPLDTRPHKFHAVVERSRLRGPYTEKP